MFPKIIHWYGKSWYYNCVHIGVEYTPIAVLSYPSRVMQAILFITYEYTECNLNVLNTTAQHTFES